MNKITPRRGIGAARARMRDFRPSKKSGRLSMATIALPPDFREFLRLLDDLHLKNIEPNDGMISSP